MRLSRTCLPSVLVAILMGACSSAPDASDSELASSNSAGGGRRATCNGSLISAVPAQNSRNHTWLSYSERRGPSGHQAHSLERHVAHDEAWLRQRLQRDRIPTASSFPDAAAAEALVDGAIDANQAAISAWLANPSAPQQLSLRGICAGACGISVHAAYGGVETPGDATVFLYKECLSDGASYFVMTAFPGPY